MKTSSFYAKSALLLCLGLAACSQRGEQHASSEDNINGVPVGQVRGVVAITDTIRTRLLDDADPATATFSVDRVAGQPIFMLRGQLGVFTTSGTQTVFQGGTPTPFSVTLWHQLFARFGDAIGDLCATGGTEVNFVAYTKQGAPFEPFNPNPGAATGKKFRLFESVAKQVTNACKFEGDQAARQTTAGELFDAVMGRGGSIAAEKEAFVAKFAADDSPFVKAAAKERVQSMFVALMFNPHFLLNK